MSFSPIYWHRHEARRVAASPPSPRHLFRLRLMRMSRLQPPKSSLLQPTLVKINKYLHHLLPDRIHAGAGVLIFHCFTRRPCYAAASLFFLPSLVLFKDKSCFLCSICLHTQAALQAVALLLFLRQLAAALKVSRRECVLRHHHKNLQGQPEQVKKEEPQQKKPSKNKTS